MATWEYGRCPSCGRRYSVLPSGQIHPHRVTGANGKRVQCPGGIAIDYQVRPK